MDFVWRNCPKWAHKLIWLERYGEQTRGQSERNRKKRKQERVRTGLQWHSVIKRNQKTVLAQNHARRGAHVFITVTCSIVGHPGTVWTLHAVGGPDYRKILPDNLPQKTLYVLPIISSIGKWRAEVVWKNGRRKLIFLWPESSLHPHRSWEEGSL